MLLNVCAAGLRTHGGPPCPSQRTPLWHPRRQLLHLAYVHGDHLGHYHRSPGRLVCRPTYTTNTRIGHVWRRPGGVPHLWTLDACPALRQLRSPPAPLVRDHGGVARCGGTPGRSTPLRRPCSIRAHLVHGQGDVGTATSTTALPP